jgi:hypothetical protein
MGLFNHYNPLDRIYIAPIQLREELLPEEQTRVLFCDSKGVLTMPIVEKSLLEILQHNKKELQKAGKYGAAVCMEVAKGQSASFFVEISVEQAAALDSIMKSAFEIERVPNTLKKYVKQIITLAEKRRKELKREYETPLLIPATPELLKQIMENPLEPIDVTFLSSKTEHVDPAIILDRLPPNEQTRPGMQRVLILDAEGTLAIIRIPIEAIDEAEQDLENFMKAKNTSGVIILASNKKGVMMGPIEIRESQKKALDTVKQYYEETRHSMLTLPIDVQAVIAKAKMAILGPIISEIAKRSITKPHSSKDD